MKDSVGRDVKVGDRIAHFSRQGSSMYCRQKVVVRVGPDRVWVNGLAESALGPTSKARNSVIKKHFVVLPTQEETANVEPPTA